jgi:hypothetical protein
VESRASTARRTEAGLGTTWRWHGHSTAGGHDPVGLGLTPGRVERLNPGSAPG